MARDVRLNYRKFVSTQCGQMMRNVQSHEDRPTARWKERGASAAASQVVPLAYERFMVWRVIALESFQSGRRRQSDRESSV